MDTRDPQIRVNFTIYNAITGEVLRSGHCSLLDYPIQQVGAGESIIEGASNWTKHRVDLSGPSPVIVDL